MPQSLEERLQRLPKGWAVERLGDLPTVQVIGYGITQPGTHTDDGVPMVRAADVQDGRLRNDEPRLISRRVHEANQRSQLRVGDVVVVLVGRVGEPALVTGEFHEWNAARTIGVIRMTESDEASWLRLWLRVWFGSSEVREWCERRATGSTLHRTLSLSVLRDLPVPLPPLAPRGPFMRALHLLEAKTATNARIADCAKELTDAQFAVEARGAETWPELPLEALAEMRTGAAARPRPEEHGVPAEKGVAFATPANILQSNAPHLHEGERRLSVAEAAVVCDPHSLLVASREDGVRVVMNEVPVVAGRNVLVLKTGSRTDAYWLLHDIRLRGPELAATAQGSAGRELSRRAFGATTVRWPPEETREWFARLASTLHARAHIARTENELLRGLQGRILDSFLSGTFPGKSAS